MNKDTRELKFRNSIAEWDLDIRNGQASKARQAIRKLNPKKIPRSLLLETAQIARRTGCPELIVSWLRPIVHSEQERARSASDPEKGIYALGLFRLGSVREAEKLLSSLDPTTDPQIRFYRAIVFMSQWRYSKAVPELKKYIQDQRLAKYSQMVGRLNLCACLVALQKKNLAQKEISILKTKLEKNHLQLLLGNLYEIRAQLGLELGAFEEALSDLQKAGELLSKADSLSQLHVDKWKVLMALKKRPGNLVELQNLESLKTRAVQAQDWETVRECDLQLAVSTQNSDLLLKVYWGSLSTHYKARALKDFGWKQGNLESFLWSEDSKSIEPVLDLVKRAPTRQLKKLMFILSREMYRPMKVAELFSFLHEDEHYNPTSSPERARRLIARGRDWLKSENIPVEILSLKEGYKLRLLHNGQLLLKKNLEVEPEQLLPQAFAERPSFTAAHWSKAKGVSLRTARRQLHNLVELKSLVKIARGPRTIYKKAA